MDPISIEKLQHFLTTLWAAWFYAGTSSLQNCRVLTVTNNPLLTWNLSSVSFSPICLSSSPLACPMLPAAVRTVWRGWGRQTVKCINSQKLHFYISSRCISVQALWPKRGTWEVFLGSPLLKLVAQPSAGLTQHWPRFEQLSGDLLHFQLHHPWEQQAVSHLWTSQWGWRRWLWLHIPQQCNQCQLGPLQSKCFSMIRMLQWLKGKSNSYTLVRDKRDISRQPSNVY